MKTEIHVLNKEEGRTVGRNIECDLSIYAWMKTKFSDIIKKKCFKIHFGNYNYV